MNKKSLILIVILGIVFLVFLVFIILRPTRNADIVQKPLFPEYSALKVGDDLEDSLSGKQISDQKPLGNEQTEYIINSGTSLRDNLVVSEKGKVVYERIVTQYRNKEGPKIEDIKASYGDADRIIPGGSKFYGRSFTYHIYATKGFSVIVDSFNGIVQEIRIFTPIGVEEYISKWGNDVENNPVLEEDLGY